MKKTIDIQQLNKEFQTLDFSNIFEVLLLKNLGKITFSTSFGQEDQAITHHIFSNNLPITIFTLDTGRLFNETYEVFNLTLQKYNKKIEVYFPKTEKVEKLVSEKGVFSFYQSIENRKECCDIRKIEPLERALKDANVWITGIRKGQSSNREKMNFFEYDERFNLIKFNPLLNWSLEELESYLEKNKIPQNKLHKKGFKSIGCAPCTRAILPDEDIRAGRWWWENSHKECGLHSK